MGTRRRVFDSPVLANILILSCINFARGTFPAGGMVRFSGHRPMKWWSLTQVSIRFSLPLLVIQQLSAIDARCWYQARGMRVIDQHRND
ncbi:hypothetical protein B0J12DRAFT_649265 [Macrophomina phaseolina]|uniref:Secreted protein n=1 Tax=Macrophomina phaseolina TaxID=35725 RepID=A0ABQ8GLJ5_9PEZI|nr:hypothetical protein B0J12DRAFT_649265 [Macrophomina phaseolina]